MALFGLGQRRRALNQVRDTVQKYIETERDTSKPRSENPEIPITWNAFYISLLTARDLNRKSPRWQHKVDVKVDQGREAGGRQIGERE